jgi:hypothetical protein
MNRRIREAFSLSLFLVLAGVHAGSQTPEGTQPAYVTYCSHTQPGESVAEIRWPVAQTVASKSAMDELVQRYTIDVTVYKQGFARGLYKSVQSPARDRQFVSPSAAPRAEAEMPGLQSLHVDTVVTSKDEQKNDLRLQARPLAGRDVITVRLNKLQPGLHYFWRIQSPQESPRTVSFTAAACPVDNVEPSPR